MKSGAGSEEVYKPSLWYYDLLHFLYDQDSARSARSTMDDEDKRKENEDGFESQDVQQQDDPGETPHPSPALSESDSNEPGTSRTPTPKPIAPRPKRKQQLTLTDELIQLTGQHLKSLRPDDEFEAYGKYIAHKLRSLKEGLVVATSSYGGLCASVPPHQWTNVWIIMLSFLPAFIRCCIPHTHTIALLISTRSLQL
ncbi:hypothetical protein O3P69_013379 [Scylla paramamosain]|uniref:Uncharacterized protein n=1 Tax=Scylla paramamosain TaxID=85552 RepID=A0AAW0U030_SCYPA